MMFVSMVAFYLVPVQLPFYLKTLASVGSTWVGVAIASLTLASAIASMNYRRIKSHVNFTGIMVFVYLLMGMGYGIIAIAQTYIVVLIGLLLAGLGLGLLIPNVNVWLSAKVPSATRGRVLGGLTSCMFLGQFSSPIISQPFVQKLGLGQTYGSFGIGLLILAVGLLILSLPAKTKISLSEIQNLSKNCAIAFLQFLKSSKGHKCTPITP
jgi:predicted MFS family arabinose efflux permease